MGLAILFIVGLAASPAIAHAANLFFSPTAGSYAVGDAFSVAVSVESAQQAANAVSGVFSFPSDKLEVVSLSKNGSVVSFWVQEPSFSNVTGTVDFEGIVLNPGFRGASGKILSVNFRAKAAGTASLIFSSGSILANDGVGTNVLDALGGAKFVITPVVSTSPAVIRPAIVVPNAEAATPTVKEEAPPVSPHMKETPAAPRIVSPTHPQSEKWYNVKDAKMTWDVPSDVTAVRVLVGKNPNATPTVTYAPAIREREIKNVEDGIWYFHAQFRNAKGWGDVAHFKFQIDTAPPEPFVITFPHGAVSDDPRPVAFFNTKDFLSGISHYAAKIGAGDLLKLDVSEIESNPYALPIQSPGKSTILVRAFDQAGNETAAVGEFEVEPLQAPKITIFPETLKTDEIFIAEGETYPDATVTIFLQRQEAEPEFQKTRSSLTGTFKIIWPKPLEKGTYTFLAHVTDDRGAQSLKSSPRTFYVEQSKLLMIGSQAVIVLAVVVPFVALVVLLLLILWYGWHKFVGLKRLLLQETREAKRALYGILHLLKKNMQSQMRLLEKAGKKRPLTREEEKILRHIQRNHERVEKFVKMEIEVIETEGAFPLNRVRRKKRS